MITHHTSKWDLGISILMVNTDVLYSNLNKSSLTRFLQVQYYMVSKICLFLPRSFTVNNPIYVYNIAHIFLI